MVTKKEALEKAVRESQYGLDCDMKVSVYDLRTEESFSVMGDKKGWAASIIKLPIMVATLIEIKKGNISCLECLPVNHKYTLEPSDFISQLPEGANVNIFSLLNYMIIDSDNEATNMIGNRVGIKEINEYMWQLGMRRSMLGHLLCKGMPRYSHPVINPDGSNVTTTDDMVRIMRHIYDPVFSSLDEEVRVAAEGILSRAGPGFFDGKKLAGHIIKAKTGVIFDLYDGADIHNVGIIDDHLIVAVMVNKICPGRNRTGSPERDFVTNTNLPYEILSETLSNYFLERIVYNEEMQE